MAHDIAMLLCFITIGMVVLSYYIDESIESKEMACKTYVPVESILG